MNKIVIGNNGLKEKNIDNNIKINYSVSNDFVAVNNLEINCLNDTDILLDYKITSDIKINVSINLSDNVKVNLFEKYNDGILKIRNSYNLNYKSELKVQKFYDVEQIKQFDVINLNGEKASINYILKTISSNCEKYNLLINHNAKNTTSNIINNAININDGQIIFDVTGVVPKGNVECLLNQNNRIVTFNQNKCQINPNLLIDENDVAANHSAFVGKFNDEELFYLQSRGINYNDAIKLLIKGFLISNLTLDDEFMADLDLIIKKYWG